LWERSTTPYRGERSFMKGILTMLRRPQLFTLLAALLLFGGLAVPASAQYGYGYGGFGTRDGRWNGFGYRPSCGGYPDSYGSGYGYGYGSGYGGYPHYGSSACCIPTGVTTALVAPTAVTVTANTGGTITLTWAASTGAVVSYRILESTANGVYVTVATTAT